jgi:predicted NACHT family NTPase
LQTDSLNTGLLLISAAMPRGPGKTLPAVNLSRFAITKSLNQDHGEPDRNIHIILEINIVVLLTTRALEDNGILE